MAHTLIRLLPDGGSQWMDAEGAAHDGLPMPPVSGTLTVLVPGEDVLLLELPRMAGSVRQVAQALPFAIEEQLVQPVEEQHVAWSPAHDAARLYVGVATRERLDGWLQRLRDAGLEPDVLLPEPLALPWRSNRPALLAEGDRIVLRLGEARALSGTAGEIAALAGQIGPPGDPAGVEVWQVQESASPLPAHALHHIEHALQALAAQALPPVLNLLQGDYVPRRRSGGARRAWRRAAGLAAATLLLCFLQAVVDRQKLAGKVAAQRDEMAQLYRSAVPGAVAATDPSRQLQSVLAARGLGRGEDVMDMLARAAPALAGGARVTLESVDYRERRLELVVQAADVVGLDGLRQRLVAAGLSAEIAGTTAGTQGVQGRLRIGTAP